MGISGIIAFENKASYRQNSLFKELCLWWTEFDHFLNTYLLVKCMMGISGIIAFENKASYRQNSLLKETMKMQRDPIFLEAATCGVL